MELSQVRALVTGGSRGMGHTFVSALRDAGAQVVFADRAGVDEAAAALGVAGFTADVSREDDVERLFEGASAALGGAPNVLINNAGILRDGLLVKVDRDTGATTTLSKADWDAVLAVNLTGPFLCMRAFAERCVRERIQPAVAVNLSSISRSGNVGQSNYSAAKAGLVADTAVWAKELARYGIRVAAVAPGFIETPMTAGMKPEALAKVLAPVPLRRMGRPEEIWQAVQFAIACDYFTGRVIEVDGGLVL
jgi:3-oxoacyl-[acyl-carrier protein] reductase